MFRSPKRSKQKQSQPQPQPPPQPQPQQQPQQQSRSHHHHVPNPAHLFSHPSSHRQQSPYPPPGPGSQTNSGYSTPQRNGMSPLQTNVARMAGPNSPAGSTNSEQQRKLTTDKIISDCYSKVIIDGGRKVNDVSYITHIGVIEYSHYPSAPPPSNTNFGTVKHRILVLCKKNSGRMQLQKGKYQADKNFYQIGRTWDLSELQYIKKVGPEGLILQLNKVYYWKCDEDANVLEGFSLDDFMLPTIPKSPTTTVPRSPSLNEPNPDPQLLKSRSLKRKNMPNPVLPQPPTAPATKTPPMPSKPEELYKDMDFTVNGALPQKQMKVISRESNDRGFASKLDPGRSVHEQQKPQGSHSQSGFNSPSQDGTHQAPPPKKHSQHPYFQRSPMNGTDSSSVVSNDSHSFVFGSNDDKNQSRERSDNSSRSSRQQQGSIGTGSQSTNTKGSQTNSYASKKQERESVASQKSAEDVVKEFSEAIPPKRKMAASATVPDFGVEEITDDSEDDQRPAPTFSIRKRQQQIKAQDKKNEETQKVTNEQPIRHHHEDATTSFADKSSHYDEKTFASQKGLGIYPAGSGSFIEESTKLEGQNSASSNLQDLQDLLSSHIDRAQEDSFDFNDVSNEKSADDLNEIPEIRVAGPSNNLNGDTNSFEGEPLEKIGWSVKDTTDTLMKKLSKELNNSKQDIVSKLVSIDLTNNSGNDIGSALNEVDNMTQIFQKMEVRLKLVRNELQSSATA
ncbi:Exocyst complex component SEC3 N-terminal PIP2 binding PH family protein [Candida albicans]|uniref:Exocyst complex component SEC3 N-terminal PIP2 binding PH family protein n=1 Tax=Candida albicans TaxID=5476 RepID=A0A8H6C2W3_CANAX|nr:Exocyst complex component SEC3 N-terminal PIP2 binding PH family protein [Candida albicans]